MKKRIGTIILAIACSAALARSQSPTPQYAQQVASGQIALPTTAVAANSCDAAATTAVATGALTTDRATAQFASDPTGVTGYGGGTNGGISFRLWVTSNTWNIKRCNETGGSITPGAISLNWAVQR